MSIVKTLAKSNRLDELFFVLFATIFIAWVFIYFGTIANQFAWQSSAAVYLAQQTHTGGSTELHFEDLQFPATVAASNAFTIDGQDVTLAYITSILLTVFVVAAGLCVLSLILTYRRELFKVTVKA